MAQKETRRNGTARSRGDWQRVAMAKSCWESVEMQRLGAASHRWEWQWQSWEPMRCDQNSKGMDVNCNGKALTGVELRRIAKA